MNYPDRAAAGPPPAWCSYPDDAAGAGAAAGDYSTSFPGMIPDYSTDDLFEPVWEQGGGASSETQPTASRLWSPRFSRPPPAAEAEVRFDPPSEDEMAAWLRAIVKGEELAINDDDGGRQRAAAAGGRDVPAAKGWSDDTSTTTETKGKLPVTEGMATQTHQEMMKPPAGGSSRRSHHGEAHNLTEKRRRHKINERLRTLQQLVPGCDKSNQASTLDQTIQYMKSLQHQVQAMSVGSARPPAATAAYPVVPPQYMPMPTAPMLLGAPPAMLPFGAMLQLPGHYPAAVPMMMPAAAAPLYPAPPPPPPPVAPGDAGSSARRRQEGLLSRSSSKGKGSSTSRSLRQKHRTCPHQVNFREWRQEFYRI